ncbi:hypothetical protein CQW23_17649 [Capsicum baccatum]|uniref:F-box domain-containing protein n=1 Tax=Capsicum baccatum TaxID=33114 RepID=A0A2G2WED3_CAPBA|nr:hypothetical protein CQW23_17649 [Capsicum baccatum]
MSHYLPDCLILDILCRLPVESLLRFTCVSKQWCSLISSPDFNSLYTTVNATTPLLVLHHFSVKPKKQQHYSVYNDPDSKTENLTLIKQLKFPFRSSSGKDFRVVGFCNGLFCLSDDLYGDIDPIILWNPAIRRSISLPSRPKPTFRCGPLRVFLGFGFDHKTCDFKVVRIAYVRGANGVYIVPPEVEVYKLSTGLWKTVNSKNINGKLDFLYSSIYLNSAIHWVFHCKNEGGKITNCLLVFGLSAETFSEMSLPQELAHVCFLSLTLCGERISVISYEESRNHAPSCDTCVVWVMNQYGKPESWMKEFIVDLRGEITKAIGFVRNGKFLAVEYPGNVLSYDPDSRELKDLDIHGMYHSFFLRKYAESLMLLDGNSGAMTDFELNYELNGGVIPYLMDTVADFFGLRG